jgi:hypothetical protein
LHCLCITITVVFPSRDTTVEAHARQIEIYRRRGAEWRLRAVLEMSDEARQLTCDGIRGRHPEYSEEDVEHALRRLLLGPDLYRQAWPDKPARSA